MLFRRLLKDQTIHYNNVINFNFGMSSFSNVIDSNHIYFAFRILSLLLLFWAPAYQIIIVPTNICVSDPTKFVFDLLIA